MTTMPRLLLAVSAVAAVAGCSNALRDFPDKGSLRYKVDQAKNALDAYEFDDAITLIAPVLAQYPTDLDVAYVASAAHAGKAGLRIIDLGAAFVSGLSTKGIFQIFAEHFPDADDDTIDEIETAVTILETAGPRHGNRTTDLNFYALFLYYSRIGATLNRYAFDSSNTLLSAFRTCRKTVDKTATLTGLPDGAVDTIMTSVPRILDAIDGLSLSGGSFSSLGSLSSALPGGVTLPYDALPCSANSAHAYCLATRLLVAQSKSEGGFGLGTGEFLCVPPLP
jgi:hypothetical protein